MMTAFRLLQQFKKQIHFLTFEWSCAEILQNVCVCVFVPEDKSCNQVVVTDALH